MVQTAKNQLFVAPVDPTEPLKPDVFHSQTLSPLEIVLFATFTHYRSICEAHVFQKTTFYHVRYGYFLVSPFSSGLNLQTNNSKQLLSMFIYDCGKIKMNPNDRLLLVSLNKKLFWIVWNVLWGEKSLFSSRFFSQIAPLSSLEEAVETEVFTLKPSNKQFKTASKSFDDAKANGVYRRISVYEKTHRYWAIAKSRASQINYIEGVYHGIVRSVLKVKGMNGLFVTMKAMCLSVKKDVVFVEFWLWILLISTRSKRLPFWQRRCDQIHLGSNIGVDGLLTCWGTLQIIAIACRFGQNINN